MTTEYRSSATDPEIRGQDFGRHHAVRIRGSLERYQSLFGRVAARRADLRALGAQALEQISMFAAPLHTEILGMASGAGLAPELLGALNARTEILALLQAPLRGECSTVVRVDPFSNRPLSLQTWDWYSEFSEDWLIWHIPHADGAHTTTVTEFGIVGKAGVNSRGLGIHFNILHHRADGRRMGVPVHVLSRHVLDSTGDINRALQLISSATVSASSALTLVAAADGSSVTVSAEVYPGGPGLVFPDASGLLVHTNHFLFAPAHDDDTEPRAFPDTLVRHDLLTRRFSARPTLSPAQAVACMSSHLGMIGAVCCHPDPTQPETGQYATLATIILDVAAGTLQALPGGPCRHAAHQALCSQSYSSEDLTVLHLKRIDNLDILTPNVQRLVDFYHGILGLPFFFPYQADEHWAAIEAGNLTLYIFRTDDGTPVQRRSAVNLKDRPGFDSFAFEVDDLDSAIGILDGKVDWVTPTPIEWQHPSGTHYRYRPMFDPDGNMLYVTEPHKIGRQVS